MTHSWEPRGQVAIFTFLLLWGQGSVNTSCTVETSDVRETGKEDLLAVGHVLEVKPQHVARPGKTIQLGAVCPTSKGYVSLL